MERYVTDRRQKRPLTGTSTMGIIRLLSIHKILSSSHEVQ